MQDENRSVKEIRHRDQAVVVVLAGDIDLQRTPEVHEALKNICQDKPMRVVINLQEVSYMDSSGVGTLVAVFREMSLYNGKMILCGITPRVRALFEITRLDKFFQIHETEEEALQA
jgi:anti-anti-sigma factor